MSRTAKILIAGDFCPLSGYQLSLEELSTESLLGPCYSEVKNCDLFAVNLEGAITEFDKPARKFGANYRFPLKTAKLMKNHGIGLAFLANNHSMDYDWRGLSESIDYLGRNKIKTIGAGINAKSAAIPLILCVNGVRIGIINCASNEFGVAGLMTPGVNGLEIYSLLSSIKDLVDDSDFIITILHSGAEDFNLPSPRTKALGRLLVDNGVDVAIFQHSHVLGCVDYYNNGIIIHGQGNFIMPCGGKVLSPWKIGMSVSLVFDVDHNIKMQPVFYIQSHSGYFLENITTNDIVDGFLLRNEKIIDDSYISDAWDSYCLIRGRQYHEMIYSTNRLLRAIMRKFGLLSLDKRSKKSLFKENAFRCEEHQEMLSRYFEIFNGK